MRKAFGLVYAIMILVLISSIGILSLEFATKSVKTVSNEHIKIQLKLYMDSAIEYALLWMSTDKSKSTGSNYKDLNITYDKYYKIIMRINHIQDYLPKESNGSVMIDMIGKYSNQDINISMSRRICVKP
jgi:hypothetical protein